MDDQREVLQQIRTEGFKSPFCTILEEKTMINYFTALGILTSFFGLSWIIVELGDLIIEAIKRLRQAFRDIESLQGSQDNQRVILNRLHDSIISLENHKADKVWRKK